MAERGRFSTLRQLPPAGALTLNLGPIALVASSSFRRLTQIFEVPLRVVSEPTLENFVALARSIAEFFSGLLNSAAMIFFTVLLALAASPDAGCAYVRAKQRGYDAFALLMLVVCIPPPIVVAAPSFSDCNLLDRGLTSNAKRSPIADANRRRRRWLKP